MTEKMDIVMNSEEIVNSVKAEDKIENNDSSEINDLYAEIASFLEVNANIKEDTGIKGTIPTGIDVLDAILGGGFPIGALNILVGQPGSGKTMLAIQTMGNAQKTHNGKVHVAFLDSEVSTTTKRMWDLGVRKPAIKPFSDITIESVFRFIEGICLFKEKKNIIDMPSVIVWDSLANTLSEKEHTTEDPNSVIGYKARLLSILIPKVVPKLKKYNISFIVINQLRDKISMGGPFNQTPNDLKFLTSSKQMPGGTVVKYNANQLLEMKVKSKLSEDKDGFDGFTATVKAVKNKLFSPNIEIELVGDFVNGFDNFKTSFLFLKQHNYLKTGPWNYLLNYPTKKFRTKDAPKLYNEDPDFQKAFDEAITEAIKEQIIKQHVIPME